MAKPHSLSSTFSKNQVPSPATSTVLPGYTASAETTSPRPSPPWSDATSRSAPFPLLGNDQCPHRAHARRVGPETPLLGQSLHEITATGGDIRRLCDLFGLSISGAERYTAVLDHPDAHQVVSHSQASRTDTV